MRTNRSGSPQLLSVISASMRSAEMSLGWSLPCWDISVRVLVRSTRVGRPSVAERRRTFREVGGGHSGEGGEEDVQSLFGEAVAEARGGVLGGE